MTLIHIERRPQGVKPMVVRHTGLGDFLCNHPPDMVLLTCDGRHVDYHVFRDSRLRNLEVQLEQLLLRR